MNRIPMAVALVLVSLGCRLSAVAQTNLFISEFMASNTRTLADEDGDFEDWIEIYNAGTNTVDLNAWYLVDGANSWRFPQTNLAPTSFLIVFASNKDRRTPGRELHTNFRLDRNGEYLALLYPDGVTVASAYTPNYPIQAPDISYGLPVIETTMTLVSTGAPAKLLVPVDGSLGTSWTLPDFSDGAWNSVTNGIGFEADAAAAFAPVIVADSAAEFSGTQGNGNWFYGYWNKTTDGDGLYNATTDFVPFPRGTGNTLSATNYWDGTKWDWPAGNPPWTELTSTGGHPSGNNGNPLLTNHWTIRRWVCETNGPLRITGTLACSSVNATCGDGTIEHIFVDGVEVFQRSVFGTSVGYSIVVNASPGSLIDFVIDPGTANNDSCDTTIFTAIVRTAGGAAVVADTIADWSLSGAQGENNWQYGYFDRTAGGTYAAGKFLPFPSAAGPHSAGNFWNGEAWQWFDGDPPFDTIGQSEARPSIFTTGGTNANEHWVIRRWVSEVSGTIYVDWHIAKKDLTGSGVTASIFHNGTQKDTFGLFANDFVGTNRTITITGVQVGDFIDLAVAPGTDVIGDSCFFNATIHGSGTLTGQFASDVGMLMTNVNATAYLRIPFTLPNASVINGLTLRMKYDDGFLAYLNGILVASANAPGAPDWNSSAADTRPDTDASQFRSFNLDNLKDFLASGPNVLAIHGLNSSSTDSDFLIVAELLATRASIDPSGKRYFASPTPGSFNGIGSTNLGPLISDVQHTPADPMDAEDLVVTAKVSPTLNAVTNVSLYYRVMFGAEARVTMLDDGLHGDGAAGDGVYGASIPNTASTNGQLVRYYLVSTDSANNPSRQPPLGDTNNSSLYFGTVVQNPALTNPLPVLHLFTQSTIDSTAFVRVTLYWQGELYDNVKMNVHGQSSQGFRNHSFNVDFNSDHHFKPDANLSRVDDINLLSSYADKSHMRVMLSYGIHADAGPRSPSHFALPVRMQSNGVFHSIMHIVENGDDNYLKRLGRDPNGALYKMYTDPSSAANAEKKTRRQEDKSDFQALVAGINSTTNRNYIYDNVDVSEAINFFAAMIVTANVDCCHKNFYLYRDSDGDGEWEMMPWDVDLSFGRNWQSGETYWDDRVYPNNGLFVGQTFPLGPFFFNNAVTRATYLRRVRTLQDQMLQTNGTPATQLNFEKQIDSWVARMTADGALDLAKWGTWGGGNGGDGGPPGGTRIDNPTNQYYRPLPQSAQEMKTNYLVNRRKFVFEQKMGNSAEFPDSQPTNVTLVLGSLDYNPSTGNQNEEYFQLINTNAFAVDISGWTLSGAIDHTFQGGVVIPRAGSSNTLYVVRDKKAFRRRATAPKGGMGLYVEGPYQGQLSARGEPIILTDRNGRSQTNTYLGNPTPAQIGLRITEIMYHPVRAVGAPVGTEEDFEYIELKNIGPTALDLNGVRFTSGIDFSFTGSSVTNLNSGQTVLIVKNLAAFSSRYGGGFNIAGTYAGFLSDSGDKLRLEDAVGEVILDFNYDNKWYPVTDGLGFSLVIVDENGPYYTWDLKQSWRASGAYLGSPGVLDPVPPPLPPIRINELLTHTDPPLVDAVELYNPTTNDVNIGGWFLTDDLFDSKKYRIPGGTMIPAGGYLVFTETNFNPNPGVPPSFSFSSKGDQAYLFSGDVMTNLSGYLHGYKFGPAENGVSFGPYVTSVGEEHFVAQSALTLGATNSGPKVGPVAITEIMYHPPDSGLNDNTLDEFIELQNISGGPVTLFPLNGTNGWVLSNSVFYAFSSSNTLPAGGYLLIVSFDPVAYPTQLDAFRNRYGLATNVPVVGPYLGKLNNNSDTLELYRPDTPEVDIVPYVLIDKVAYKDVPPWPDFADGFGPSLQRKSHNQYGNDPINWTAGFPTPGGAFPGGSFVAPSIVAQPATQSVLVGANVNLSVNVSGSAPFGFQWRYNGINIDGATSSNLALANVQMDRSGVYSVAIFNNGGGIVSSNATLSVTLPPVWLTSLTNVTPRLGSNVVFNTAVSSVNLPLTYQWFFNGTNLNLVNASNSLVRANVQFADEGLYTVIVTDRLGGTNIAAATLAVYIVPVLTQHPTGLTVLQGATVTFTAAATGRPLPLSFRWRKNPGGVTLTNVTQFETNISYSIFNAQPSNSATYTVVVTNLAGSSALSSNAVLTVLADNDHDLIPDDWERLYGFSTNDVADASSDPDLDGMTNLQEYLAGTDPTNGLSYLRIDAAPLGGAPPASLLLTLSAVSNHTYTIICRDDVLTGTWSRLADIDARVTNRIVTVTNQLPAGVTNRFYRLQTPRLP